MRFPNGVYPGKLIILQQICKINDKPVCLNIALGEIINILCQPPPRSDPQSAQLCAHLCAGVALGAHLQHLGRCFALAQPSLSFLSSGGNQCWFMEMQLIRAPPPLAPNVK